MSTTDEAPYTGTHEWMGNTLTTEAIAHMKAYGLNPWLTAVSGQPVPEGEQA
jgi:hypothetical protein